ncbi:Cytochrome C oxidase subunit III [Flavobacterium sp. 9AF]|uniref:cbb3-type cytochrome c oxidase N-terminal domain-containing protein n=1 Tax=Flavobacterium sp. 9AF TaxID=2653142 RepID=UPI0012F12091|nr:cbb3-type cytochrome c oxidase N-terminal domain-containing protein [Flavobacterium sp. 9AF]VXB87057.1 Cytochrome C oxidase subunit III [Flavobacterium sp. 9AF]
MKNIIPSYVRVPLIFAAVFAGMEYFIDSGEKPAFIEYPMVSVFLFVFLFLLIAIEIVISAVDKVTYQLLSEEQKKQLKEAQELPFTESAFYKNIMKKLTRSKAIEQEADVMLDHNYDGIKELDNVLPPWWVYLFYGTLIFAAVYLIRFHIVGDYTQKEEYEMAMLDAQKEHEEYLKNAPDLVNLDNVELMKDAASIADGKRIFTENNCASCHKENLEGNIGPNLTDAYWINGGGIKNIFKVISEGSQKNTVMAPWKEVIKPTDIQKLASYIISLQGSNPANAKAPEGELWVEEGAAVEAKKITDEVTKVTDSIVAE